MLNIIAGKHDDRCQVTGLTLNHLGCIRQKMDALFSGLMCKKEDIFINFRNSAVITDHSFYIPNNHLHAAFPGFSSDRVGVEQWWTHRADGGEVHGPPENHPARLVPEHGRWGDVAE